MKKISMMIVLAAAATNINAQLVVDSLGRVGIGTGTPLSQLSVGTAGSNDTAIRCDAQGKNIGLYLKNFTNSANYTYGTYSDIKNLTGKCFGGRCEVRGGSNMSSSQIVIGMGGYAGEAHSAAGIMGAKISSSVTPVNFAGVYGSETAGSDLYFGNYSGTYAGYFRGKVRVTNGIYATVLSPAASASPSGQSGTTILSDRSESVTDKLGQVQTLQFLRSGFAKEESENEKGEEEEEIKSQLSPIQYGLAADQLKAVYPELVYEDQNGNVSINYVEMVPLLVQSIKELSAKVAELEGSSAKKAKAQPTAIEENASDIDMVRMDQNMPNPFSESTVIALNIPTDTQTATIFIYDMSGKQVKSIPVSERGETDITVYAADLTAGMYIYTLVVDGKVAVTRRMIVSKN